jgi:hypothetical protein
MHSTGAKCKSVTWRTKCDWSEAAEEAALLTVRTSSEVDCVSVTAGASVADSMFQAAVTDAVGHIVKQTSEQPPKHLVKLLFSFRGVTEVEVPADRIHADR